MKDFQVVSALTQLKALVAGLYGRIDSLTPAAAPAVDFAVDMFDRQDQDSLGPYWSNTNYAVRGNTALLSVGTTPILATICSLLPGNPQVVAAYSMSYAATPATAVYLADITSSDFSCTVLASVPGYDNVAPSGEDAGRAYSHYVAVGDDPANYYQVGAGAGVCIANTQNVTFGAALQTAQAPAQSVSDDGGSCGVATASTPMTMVSRITIGSNTKVNLAPQDADISNTDVITGCAEATATVSAGKFNIMNIGLNTITQHCSADNVMISVNSTPVFSGTPASVARKSRARAGIMTGPESATSALDAAPLAAVGGITSFKVWRNDIPEPPNESGHGTYVNGRWQYTDKYHTPVTDEDGNVIRNEDGTVASYIYDPEA